MVIPPPGDEPAHFEFFLGDPEGEKLPIYRRRVLADELLSGVTSAEDVRELAERERVAAERWFDLQRRLPKIVGKRGEISDWGSVKLDWLSAPKGYGADFNFRSEMSEEEQQKMLANLERAVEAAPKWTFTELAERLGVERDHRLSISISEDGDPDLEVSFSPPGTEKTTVVVSGVPSNVGAKQLAKYLKPFIKVAEEVDDLCQREAKPKRRMHTFATVSCEFQWPQLRVKLRTSHNFGEAWESVYAETVEAFSDASAFDAGKLTVPVPGDLPPEPIEARDAAEILKDELGEFAAVYTPAFVVPKIQY